MNTTPQNQHYVPKFILRQFLSDKSKEQVTVYDKHNDNMFKTSIKNIMAEREFNDFTFGDDLIVSFEPIACAIEDMVLPRYQDVVSNRRLNGSAEEKVELSLLLAFQMVRTKSHREMFSNFEQQIREQFEASGHKMEDIGGYKPATEARLKQTHLTSFKDAVPQFAQVIAQKDFWLARSMENREFYLGDNPVSIHNRQTFGPYGNLGLAMPGIEIYMPLATDLMLCAWCPSIIPDAHAQIANARKEGQQIAIAAVMAGRLTPQQMKDALQSVEPEYKRAEMMLEAVKSGQPVESNNETMDFYNSLQMGFAHRFIINRHGDFELARRHNQEFPNLRKGRQPIFG